MKCSRFWSPVEGMGRPFSRRDRLTQIPVHGSDQALTLPAPHTVWPRTPSRSPAGHFRSKPPHCQHRGGLVVMNEALPPFRARNFPRYPWRSIGSGLLDDARSRFKIIALDPLREKLTEHKRHGGESFLPTVASTRLHVGHIRIYTAKPRTKRRGFSSRDAAWPLRMADTGIDSRPTRTPLAPALGDNGYDRRAACRSNRWQKRFAGRGVCSVSFSRNGSSAMIFETASRII